mgnify:CR=1 FL=1
MKTGLPHSILVALGLLMGVLPQTAPKAAPVAVVVCYPGGPINEADANAAMTAMLRVIERVGDWPQNQFASTFTVEPDQCRTLLTSQNPPFAITSLGLYLDQRKAQHLEPIVQPRMKGQASEQYRILVQKGKFASLDALKGKTLGGTVFGEPDFLSRVVFAGKIDPANYFEVKPGKQALRALRSLDRGEIDAVLVNGQQYSALSSLPLQSTLEPVFTSDPIPLMGLVANTSITTPEDRQRFEKALTATCSDPEGKKLCDLFGIDGFVSANKSAIEASVKRWEQAR